MKDIHIITGNTSEKNLKRMHKYRVLILFSFFCLLYGFVIGVCCNMPFVTVIKYCIGQIFFLFLPGYAGCIFLLKQQRTYLEISFLSYAIGYAFNIVEYIVIYLAGLGEYSIYFVIAIALLSIIIIYKNDTIDLVKDKKLNTIIILCLFLIVNIIAYSGNTISPEYNKQGCVSVNRDLQFWCSNAASLKLNFQPMAVYFMGGKLFYHYFSSIHVAFLSRITNIDIYSLAFTLFPLEKSILLVGGLDYLFSLYSNKYKSFVMLFILFMSGLENKVLVTYGWHIIVAPFGFDIGLAYGIWFLSFLYTTIYEKRIKLGNFCITVLFWTVCVGAKAPVASVYLMAAFIVCVYWLTKKRVCKAFLYGGSTVLIFLIISIFCTGILRQISNSNMISTHVATKVINAQISSGAVSIQNEETSFELLPTFLNTVVYSHPILIILSIANTVGIIKMLILKEIKIQNTFVPISFMVTALFGYFMGSYIKAVGHSEMYFTMASFAPMAAFNVSSMSLYKFNVNKKIHFLFRCVQVLMVVIGCYFMLYEGYGGGLSQYLSNGIEHMEGTKSYVAGLTKEEVLAYKWISQNTSKDSVILNDKSTVGGIRNSYYAGIFSERQQYIEATDILSYLEIEDNYNRKRSDIIAARCNYAEKVYSGDKEALADLKRKGIDYVIQDDAYSSDLVEEKYLEPVYEMETITVYKVLIQ